MTPTSAPASAHPENATPAAISASSSSRGMYGSCQRSAGITPRYASAAAFTIARVAPRSSSRQGRMAMRRLYGAAVAYDEDLANRIRELLAGEKGVTEKK